MGGTLLNLGKKALSAVTSAALLASLVATAIAPSAFAATTAVPAPLFPYHVDVSTTKAADGLSYYNLVFDDRETYDYYFKKF